MQISRYAVGQYLIAMTNSNGVMARIVQEVDIRGERTTLDTGKDVCLNSRRTAYLHCYRVNELSNPRDYRAVKYVIREGDKGHDLVITGSDYYSVLIEKHLSRVMRAVPESERIAQAIEGIARGTPEGAHYILFQTLARSWNRRTKNDVCPNGGGRHGSLAYVIRRVKRSIYEHPELYDEHVAAACPGPEVAVKIINKTNNDGHYPDHRTKRKIIVNGKQVVLDINRDLALDEGGKIKLHYSPPYGSRVPTNKGVAVKYRVMDHAAGTYVKIIETVDFQTAIIEHIMENVRANPDGRTFAQELAQVANRLPQKSRTVLLKTLENSPERISPAE